MEASIKVAIYARVSTADQHLSNQLEELTSLCEKSGWNIVRIYQEKISGSKSIEQREAISELLADGRRRQFDKVVIWSVDRLARSLSNLINILLELKSLNINVFSYKQSIDTASPMGAMFFQFLGIFAEFENTIRKERQLVGIRRAKARGVHFGRKPTSPAQIEKIKWMRRKGHPISEICRSVKVSPNTVCKILRDVSAQ